MTEYRSPQFHFPVQIFQDVLEPGLRFDPRASEIVAVDLFVRGGQRDVLTVPSNEAWRVRYIAQKEADLRITAIGDEAVVLADYDDVIADPTPYIGGDMTQGRLDSHLLFPGRVFAVDRATEGITYRKTHVIVEKFSVPDVTAALTPAIFYAYEEDDEQYPERLVPGFTAGVHDWNNAVNPPWLSASDGGEMTLALVMRIDCDSYNEVQVTAANDGDNVVGNESHCIIHGNTSGDHTVFDRVATLTGAFPPMLFNLDITALTGEKFLRIHAVSGGAGILSRLEVTRIRFRF